MTKLKHPKNKAERRLISKKKDHANASPVYKLLKEKELSDAKSSRLPRNPSPGLPEES